MSTPDPELEPAEALRAELEAEIEAELAAGIADIADIADVRDAPGDSIPTADVEGAGPEVAIGLSPRQILGGFVVVAAIVVWLFRRRKR